MNLPFFIAKRYLISKKSHNAINIISGISIAGICVGTASLIIVLSAFNGLSDLVKSLYNSFDADIEIIVKQGKTFDSNSPEMNIVRKTEGIAYFTEIVEGNALLKLDDRQCVTTIKGVSSTYEKMSGFDSLVSDGQFNIEKNNVVIGKGISSVLETGTNQLSSLLSVYAPKRGTINVINPEEGLNELKVYPAGAFSINDEFDFKYTIMNIDKARELFDYTNEVTSIELKLKPGVNKQQLQEKITEVLGDKYEIKNREQQNELLYKTLKSEKLWTSIILLFILIVATFNVIGSLTMLIIEKKKDIGILYNMGADAKLIRRIFLIEGMLITLVGALLGIISGVFICWLQTEFSLVKLTEGFLVDAYPISMQMPDFVMVISAVLLIGFFAAWYPVRVVTKRYLTN